jgi:hypothetical protein
VDRGRAGAAAVGVRLRPCPDHAQLAHTRFVMQGSAPSINSRLPARVVVLNALQTSTFRGAGLRPETTVTVGSTWGNTTLSGAAVRWENSSTVKILANVGTSQAQWWASVNNPDGSRSGVYRFDVKSATRIRNRHVHRRAERKVSGWVWPDAAKYSR